MNEADCGRQTLRVPKNRGWPCGNQEPGGTIVGHKEVPPSPSPEIHAEKQLPCRKMPDPGSPGHEWRPSTPIRSHSPDHPYVVALTAIRFNTHSDFVPNRGGFLHCSVSKPPRPTPPRYLRGSFQVGRGASDTVIVIIGSHVDLTSGWCVHQADVENG